MLLFLEGLFTLVVGAFRQRRPYITILRSNGFKRLRVEGKRIPGYKSSEKNDSARNAKLDSAVHSQYVK